MVTHRYCTTCGAANQAQDAFCFACGKPLQTTTPLPQYPVAGSASNTLTGLLIPNHLLKQRYRILSQLGKGGFGAIYKAEDTQLGNRLLAVKEMSQSSLSPQEIIEATENFKRETLLLASLKHPNLPSIYDHFSEAGRWYLVMDFIEGETLEEHLNQEPQGHLSVEETLRIGMQLCAVLGYLHGRQPPIIFRDLKPANVMISPDGHLYLIDFGIARHFKPGQAKDTIAFGSPGYAAPEQYGKAQTTARSDIYSLGATLHYLLTGIDPSLSPFQFAPLQQQGRPAPPGLESLIMQMLEINESKRPDSMITVKQQLQNIDTQHPTGQINAPQTRVTTQPGASPPNPLPPTQTHSASSIQHQVTPKMAGGTYLNTKRYQEALLAYEQAIQLDPDDAVIYNGKGLALSNLNRYGEALIAYEQAVQLNPGFENAYINKAYVLYKLRRLPEAFTACERAIQLGPNNASFYNLKGLVCSDLNRYEEALAAYEQAIRLDPNITTAYNNKSSLLYSLKRYQEALVSCEQAIRLDPRNAVMHNFKGNILLAMKRYGEALAAYEQAIRLDPRYAQAYSNRGNVLSILKRYWEALATCEQALRLDLNLASAYNNKGVALYGLKRYGEAIGVCDQAILLDPNLAIAYHNKGLALQSLRRSKEAQQAFKMARRRGYRG